MKVFRDGVRTDSQISGNWGYHSGRNGTLNISGGKRVLGIYAIATVTGTIQINGGDLIAIIGGSLNISPQGNLIDPTIVFNGTNTYFVEYLTGRPES